MSGEHRKADAVWKIDTDDNGLTPNSDAALAVLMDIRHELKLLNAELTHQRMYMRSLRDEVRQVNQRMLKAGFKVKG